MPVTKYIFVSLDEFTAEHGKGVFINNDELAGNGRFVCSDGASYSNEGYCEEPPDDPKQLLQFRLAHYRTRLNQEQEDYLAYKSSVAHQASWNRKYKNLPAPNVPEVRENLKRGRKRISDLQAIVAILVKEWDEITGWSKKLKEAEQAERERAAKVAELIAVLNESQIPLTPPSPASSDNDTELRSN